MKFLTWFILSALASITFGQIRIAEPTKELGDVLESQGIVKTTFDLFNPFLDDTISIRNIHTSCGCTAILTTQRIILPRQTLQLVIAYDPSGRPGLFMKSIELETVTGADEHNRLYLKITGNVIPTTTSGDVQNPELTEYRVAPIYFIPVTAFDTSYLDFDFVTSFINDITFEIDYHQFTTVGIDVIVEDEDIIPDIENLISYLRRNFQRGLSTRGFNPNLIFFETPRFTKGEIPIWSVARIKMFSSNFNDDSLLESEIISATDESESAQNYLLNYQRFQLPILDDVLKEVNFSAMESKLFLNGGLDLRGIAQISASTSTSDALRLLQKLSRAIYKRLKAEAGVDASNVRFEMDSVVVHPENKIRILLWDKSDEKAVQKIVYVSERDKLMPPLLPTCRQSTVFQSTVDMATREFRSMWKNVILNQKAGREVSLVVEASVSYRPSVGEGDTAKYLMARRIAEEARTALQKKFKAETGRDLVVEVRFLVLGPPYTEEFAERIDYDQFEYINIIPVVKPTAETEEPRHSPYQVNFDYFFNGIDTTSFVFVSFAKNLAKSVQRDGYVEMRIESSISQVPIERHTSNEFLCSQRSLESQYRLKEYLRHNLIDPNRVLFIEERNLIQGPEYDRKTPILAYRNYQYLRIVPEKYLRHDE